MTPLEFEIGAGKAKIPATKFLKSAGEEVQIMNANKRFMIVSVPNAMLLLAAVACCYWEVSRWLSPGGGRMARTKVDAHPAARPQGSNGFGPEVVAVLPGNKECPELFNLETGRRLPQPDYERSKLSGAAIMDWVRTNGLDISASIWPGGAACITYNMLVFPVEAQCWDKTQADELLENPALASNQQAPRRLLILGHGRTNTYLFRTGEGTLGMLQIVGLSEDGLGIQIRYRLIEAQRTRLAASVRGSNENRGDLCFVGSHKATASLVCDKVILSPFFPGARAVP
jgi:hypothetical protein